MYNQTEILKDTSELGADGELVINMGPQHPATHGVLHLVVTLNGETIKNAADFSMYLLNTAHVSSVMGDAFGEPNCVRFSFANSMPNIEKAWARIKDALAKLK